MLIGSDFKDLSGTAKDDIAGVQKLSGSVRNGFKCYIIGDVNFIVSDFYIDADSHISVSGEETCKVIHIFGWRGHVVRFHCFCP